MKKEINGVVFKVVSRNTSKADSIITNDYRYNNIYSAYERPSHTKIHIWEWWKEWSKNNDLTMWISSRNCHHFSIQFHGWIENKECYGLITATRNEVVFCE